MKSYWMMGLSILLLIAFATISVHALEIRGSVAGTVNGASNLIDSFSWSPQNFAGFDYDIDHDVGYETLTTTLTGDNKLSGDEPYGIVYEASNRIKALSSAHADMKYGKLRVSTIDSTGTIILDNKDNAITLSKNRNIEILPGIFIRTADNDTLRYYIYKNITKPGTYEVRGSVAGTVNDQSNLDPAENSFTWNPQNFAGFYYDIKKDLGTETLKTTLTEDNILSGDAPYGITYITTAQSKAFERSLWGGYNVIGFQAEKYFAGYNEGDTAEYGSNIFYRESTDRNSLSSEQLEKILMDEKSTMIVKKGESIKLKEGYELILKGVNSEGQIYLELSKNGSVVDGKVVSPSKTDATEMDKTYYYKNPQVGEQKNLVTIGVHFKNTYKDEELAVATVDGIWQISDVPTDIQADTQYGKMTIMSIDANSGVITMGNKDNTIILTRKSDIELMPGINIRTADNDTLRYYIYRTETVSKSSM
ncbi:MAG: S-layer protein domain-containing protein [Methanothrix sp.]